MEIVITAADEKGFTVSFSSLAILDVIDHSLAAAAAVTADHPLHTAGQSVVHQRRSETHNLEGAANSKLWIFV